MTTKSQELVEKISPVIFTVSLNSYAFSFTLLSELGVQSLNSTTDLVIFAARVAIDAMTGKRLFALGLCLFLAIGFFYFAMKFQWQMINIWSWSLRDRFMKLGFLLSSMIFVFFMIEFETFDQADWSYAFCFFVVYSPVFLWYARTLIAEQSLGPPVRWLAALMLSGFIGSAYLGSYGAPQFITFPGVMHKETAKLFLWDDSGGTSYVDCNEEIQRVEVWKGTKNEPIYYYYVSNSDILGHVCERSFQ